MVWIFAIVCLLAAVFTAVWFSPLRGHLVRIYSVVRPYLSWASSFFDRYRFSCRVEQLSDESQPVRQDQFFRIQIVGRIPTEQKNVDTEVQVEVLDVTDGQSKVHQVLSSDEQYRDDETFEFHLIQPNGVVPEKNAVLARRVTVACFPCHILRFAYRGRRKLLFRTTVIETISGEKLVSAQHIVEYVYCSDGYREVHRRRLEVLGACVELSAVILGSPPYSENIRSLWSEWIRQKVEMYISEDEAAEKVETIQNRFSDIKMQLSSDVILAYGKKTDCFSAMELAMQTIAFNGIVRKENFERLLQVSQMLEIHDDRFLSSAQKILLSSDCQIEAPSQLLGITPDMDDETFRKQLNEEYRKWNARVTHPDAQIRFQADQILTLIAEIRSQWLQSTA